MSWKFWAGVALLAIALLGAVRFLRRRPAQIKQPAPEATTPAAAPSAKGAVPSKRPPPVSAVPRHAITAPVPALRLERSLPANKPTATSAPPTLPAPKVSALPGLAEPAPPAGGLHVELIPRDIAIVDCYYSQEVVGPGTAFGFDIDGSGFTADFAKMIALDAGAREIGFKNLRLVTANQIHGEIEVGLAAATAFIRPFVLINGLPVFSAPRPFGVVRPGEVLTIQLTDVSEDGRSSHFRVVTNIDDNMFKQLWIEPTKPGLKVSQLRATLPYAVDGIIDIADAAQGSYGLVVSLFSREIYLQEAVSVVKPNLGKTGLVVGVAAVDPYHRPGDVLRLMLDGNGFSREDTRLLGGHVDEYAMGKPAFAYLSPKNIQVAFNIPPTAPDGSYGVTITGLDEKILLEASGVFVIVPPLWVRGVAVEPPVVPGARSTLKVIGRDLTPEFAKDLRIETDEAGIAISDPKFVDASALVAGIAVGSSVAPGDYLLYLHVKDAPVKPQFGSIIKVSGR